MVYIAYSTYHTRYVLSIKNTRMISYRAMICIKVEILRLDKMYKNIVC